MYNTSILSVVEGSSSQAAAFYYSWRFAHDFGIFNTSYHNVTSTLRAFQTATGQLEGALTCANFPPSTGYFDERCVHSHSPACCALYVTRPSDHLLCASCTTCYGTVHRYNLSRIKSYLPETFMWVRAIREGAFLLPFTEDYIFQIAAGSQQMFDLMIDVERAAVRPKSTSQNGASPKEVAQAALRPLPETATVPGRPIMQYTMVCFCLADHPLHQPFASDMFGRIHTCDRSTIRATLSSRTAAGSTVALRMVTSGQTYSSIRLSLPAQVISVTVTCVVRPRSVLELVS